MAIKIQLKEIICHVCGRTIQCDENTIIKKCSFCDSDLTSKFAKLQPAFDKDAVTKCPICGGKVSCEPITQQFICKFCDAHVTLDSDDRQTKEVSLADYIIPFKVDNEEFNQKIILWLIEGEYTPDDILVSSIFKQITGIFLPFYYFYGSFDVKWIALSGYYREETYTGYVTRYKNSQSFKTPVTKIRTITDWLQSSGSTHGEISQLVIATDVLSDEFNNFSEELSDPNTKLKDFDKKYISGFCLNPFKYSDKEIYEQRATDKIYATINNEVKSCIPGETCKDINWNGEVKKENISVFMPYWLSTYTYKNKTYRCILDGNDSSRILGDKPVDENRVKMVKGYYIPLKLAVFFTTVITFIIFLSIGLQAAFYTFLVGLMITLPWWVLTEKKKNETLEKSKDLRQELYRIYTSKTFTKDEKYKMAEEIKRQYSNKSQIASLEKNKQL